MAEKLVPFTTRIPAPLRKRIKARALRDDVRVEKMVRLLFETGLRFIDHEIQAGHNGAAKEEASR